MQLFASPGEFVPLHTAAVADSTGNVMTVWHPDKGGYTFACFQISGTVTTATITFEGTVDGTNWVSLEAESLGSSSTKSTTATAAGVWRATVVGLKYVRANLDWTAGSINVVGSLA
jgi:hypothetical protein